MEKFTPESRRHWRSWLDQHNGSEREIWLVFFKKHTGKANLSYNDAVEEAICFGWIDGIRRSIDGERYMHRFTPRKPGSKWSESNIKRANHLLRAGTVKPAGLKAIEGAKKDGNWIHRVEPSKKFAMPPELEQQLKSNLKADSFFATLAPSFQQQFIAWIATAKRPETRERRLDETMALLERGETLGMR